MTYLQYVKRSCAKLQSEPYLFLHISSYLGHTFTTACELEGAVRVYRQFPECAIYHFGPIEMWDVHNITNMECLFCNFHSFNQDISFWDVSQVTNMTSMFLHAESFNQPLESWQVENVKSMHGMFAGASKFNQPLSKWKLHNEVDTSAMFFAADSFRQSIPNITGMDEPFHCEDGPNPWGNWSWELSSELL